MSEKIINIPFHYNQFILCQRVYWTYHAKKFYSRNIKFSILGLALFMLVLLLNDGKQGDIVALAITGGYTFYLLMIWLGFIERRIKFMRRSKALAEKLKTANVTATYTFSPNKITYIDHEKSYSFHWQLFAPFEVYKDHILLTLKENGTMVFLFGRHELGDDCYFNIQEILKEKTGDLTMHTSETNKSTGK